ncbi:Ammonium transporter [Methanimicrococcus hongohii]|uniref:Ammonium transporter n=1 Tax=Methanimicrococcus hongohii TaxID=3028295 RepID=A0AA96VA20_9EURY|nr:ammonium transporter [Methanimicrococcus sp. Hf6]WNY23222.1 Ammonium transporter [Methanimicrococcus sp. Hf6]
MAIDSGSTALIIISAALVTLMIPALGLFYGGLVRKKNIISMVFLSFLALSIVSIQWVFFGYSLAFGPDIAGVIGGLDYVGLIGIGLEDTIVEGIPDILFILFQMIFAGISLAIITSGFAERVKLSSFIVFGLLWTTLVYDPLAHWAWGGGWAHALGALDFAGGTVVHISAGFGALAAAFVIGKRSGFGETKMVSAPQNIPLTLLGAGLLWVGWFGFNGGSALAADGIAALAVMNTAIAAAAGALSWMLISSIKGKPSAVGLVSGALAGLVGITPAAGYVEIFPAIIIGGIASIVCYYALIFRVKKGWDESLDAWAIHGVGGLWGAIATGIFASSALAGVGGLIEGNFMQFAVNAGEAIIAVIFSFAVTYIIALAVKKVMGLRVSEIEEDLGLDISNHGERA